MLKINKHTTQKVKKNNSKHKASVGEKAKKGTNEAVLPSPLTSTLLKYKKNKYRNKKGYRPGSTDLIRAFRMSSLPTREAW